MANAGGEFPAVIRRLLLLFILFLCSSEVIRCSSERLQASQAWSLLRLRRLLGFPPSLSSWNNSTDPCYGDSPSPAVVCYGDSVTQLHISGGPGTPPLARSFSLDSFFTTLTHLPALRVLSLSSLGLWGALPGPKIARLPYLEILDLTANFLYGPLPDELASLADLQTIVLDHNMFSGRVPAWVGGFSRLAVLTTRNNSLSGPLPNSLSDLVSLRVLVLSSNSLSGALPDLSALTNLQVLDVGDNYLGPAFPEMGKKVSTAVLRNNRFTGGLPPDVGSYHLLQHLDLSYNRFLGPLPLALFSLPSIRYLDIAENRFTGMLFANASCGDVLGFVNVSSNLLTGSLPACLAEAKRGKNVSYAMNCLSSRGQEQHQYAFCRNEALAVSVLPRKGRKKSGRRAVVAGSVVAGAMGVFLAAAFLSVYAIRRANVRKEVRERAPRRLVEHAANGYPPKLLSDARYISQTMKLGTIGLPSYRSFSLEELETATNNFDTAVFMDEGFHGQMYRGKLNDGTLVAIRCLKLKRSHSSHNITRHIELFAKLRHCHLVSALGHCLEYYLDDSTVSRLFLIFEYITNGTLRSNVSEGTAGQKLTWSQRIYASIGVAKGIQFLHSGIIPGLFANGLKTSNIMLDQNLVAKICSYNLPVIAEDLRTEASGSSSNALKCLNGRVKDEGKIDIHDFGVILLEIISGSPVTSHDDIDMIKEKFQASLATNGVTRRGSIVDPAVHRSCSDESLRTMMEICMRCLSLDPTKRPSIDDVLWNLQFAAQVQDAWRGDSQSSYGSAVSPSQTPPQPSSVVI